MFKTLVFCTSMFLLLMGCTSAPEKAPTGQPVWEPPSDVKIYSVGKLEKKDTGPGGFRLEYVTQSPPEAVIGFVEREWPKRGWIPVTVSSEGRETTLRYFRKDQRLLMLIVKTEDENAGCRFTVMETKGEAPRGNTYETASPENGEAASEAGEH